MASLTDAEEALRSTNTKANFQRLTRLLMRGGLMLLREKFDSIHSPADLPFKLGDPTIQRQLKGARLTKPERDCLYPSSGVYGKSTDCDITLIFRLLRTICNLTPPPGLRGWDDLPNSTDHSLEADLVRIKYYRNNVYGHKKTMELSDVEFVGLWNEISEVLLRIAATISHAKRNEWKKFIDDFLHDPLTPEEETCIEELSAWYKQDMDVKIEVEKLKEEIKYFKKDFLGGNENIQEEVQSLREDMKGGHENIQGVIQEEFRSLREAIVPILVVNTVGSIVTQNGFQLIINHPSGSPQLPQIVESEGSCAIHVPIHPDQEQPVGAEGYSGELQPNQWDPPTEIQIWNVILSFKKSFELFLQYLRYKLNVNVRSHDVGSLLITVECSSLQILEGLWEDYCSGHLNKVAQEMLITPQVLEKVGLRDVTLKSFISEEEYEKGKRILKDNSALDIGLIDEVSDELQDLEKKFDVYASQVLTDKERPQSTAQLLSPATVKAVGMAEEEDDKKLPVYKVSLCGKSEVGKTSIFRRLRGDGFKDDTSKFEHLAGDKIKVPVKDKTIKIDLWDTSGMERYSRLTRQHYFGSHVVLLVYDCDDVESLQALMEYYNDGKNNANGAAMVLVRNKIDKDLQGVDVSEAEKLLCNHQEKGTVCKFKFKAETSAKKNTGIKELIEKVAEYLVKNAEPSNSRREFDKVKVKPDPLPTPPPPNRCCSSS